MKQRRLWLGLAVAVPDLQLMLLTFADLLCARFDKPSSSF